jgi:hypothetical protein
LIKLPAALGGPTFNDVHWTPISADGALRFATRTVHPFSKAANVRNAPIFAVLIRSVKARKRSLALAVSSSVILNLTRNDMGYSSFDPVGRNVPAWNASRKIGPKRALKQKEIWAIRFWLKQEGRVRDRALFDVAVDSKLRGCDLVRLKIGDLVSGNDVRS